MWHPPAPGIEPVSPALAGGFPSTIPPGKSLSHFFCLILTMPSPMWDLSSLTRDQTLNPSLGVLSPKLPGSPSPIFLDFLPPRKMSEVLI